MTSNVSRATNKHKKKNKSKSPKIHRRDLRIAPNEGSEAKCINELWAGENKIENNQNDSNANGQNETWERDREQMGNKTQKESLGKNSLSLSFKPKKKKININMNRDRWNTNKLCQCVYVHISFQCTLFIQTNNSYTILYLLFLCVMEFVDFLCCFCFNLFVFKVKRFPFDFEWLSETLDI